MPTSAKEKSVSVGAKPVPTKVKPVPTKVKPVSAPPAPQIKQPVPDAARANGSSALVGKSAGKPRSPKGRAKLIKERLTEAYPDALCELDHESPFQLLAATILSAQCTDARVNRVTPVLFARFPSPADLAGADPLELEEIIHATGFFRNKAKSLIGMAAALTERYDGQVPGPMEDLITVPGVGRKTANVVRSVALGLPGLPVDTHVIRLSHRLGLTKEDDPVKIEHELNAMIAGPERGSFSLRMILHGRRICAARKPNCADCTLADFCPSAGK